MLYICIYFPRTSFPSKKKIKKWEKTSVRELPIIQGLIAATFTPSASHHNGSLNLAALPNHVDLLLHNKIEYIFVNRTVDEGALLTISERKEIAEKWVQATRNKLQGMGNYFCGRHKILNAEGADAAAAAASSRTTSKESALELSRAIQRLMLGIQGEHLSEDGKRVDYAAVKTSAAFAEYIETTRRLRECQVGSLEDDERKAFFINIYNALNIHGIISSGGLPASMTGKAAHWKWTAYVIGGLVFSLDDIEHGILRDNSPKPIVACGRQFSKSDPRAKLRLAKDPRIHFALNCGAVSCPAIRVYSADNLERGLQGAASNFFSCEVKMSARGSESVEFKLSHLFKWYRGDFVPIKSSKLDPVLEWIAETDPESDVAQQIREASIGGKRIVITYAPYDWSSNDTH